MKRLAIYLHPYLGRIGLGFTIKFMGTLLDLMIPWMLSTIIDEVIPTREFQQVLLWGCMMLLCSAAVFAFNVIPNRMASAVARDVTEEVRRDLYQKATLLSCAQMDRITIPSVISRLTTDTTRGQAESATAIQQLAEMAGDLSSIVDKLKKS